MRVIGLTGGIASGKSVVTHHLHELGALVIDADQLAREAVAPGGHALAAIVECFGSGVLTGNGSLDRKKLAGIVFNCQEAREKLNSIIHPLVIGETKRLIGQYKREKTGDVVVVDAPLLLETGMATIVDQVWVVAVPENIQIERLMKRDAISEEEARLRMASQMSLADKLKRADRVIDNSGSIDHTMQQVDTLWKEIVSP